MFIGGIIHLVKYKLLERDKIFVDPKFGEKYLVMQPDPPRGYLTSSERKAFGSAIGAGLHAEPLANPLVYVL